jgi:hypothetical protein
MMSGDVRELAEFASRQGVLLSRNPERANAIVRNASAADIEKAKALAAVGGKSWSDMTAVARAVTVLYVQRS